MFKKLYNIPLCYHSITKNSKNKSKYTTYIDDFKSQISSLIKLGYQFLFPSIFFKRYNTGKDCDTPFATIIFDDGLNTINDAVDWLNYLNIPFGISIIAYNQRKLTPNDGYLSWNQLKDYNCEILSQSYNLHHFALANFNGEIKSTPILERPAYIDNGFIFYLDKDSKKYYFDLSLLENALAFPLIGTDIQMNTAIISTIEFKADKNFTGKLLRLWASLSYPYSKGYDVELEILINEVKVFDNIFNTDSSNNQWPEREFVSIYFDKEYTFSKNEIYKIEFKSKNIGNSAFRIYGVPNFNNNYKIFSNYSNGDYPPNINWDISPCIIIGDGSGYSYSEKEYLNYVDNDFLNFKYATKNYFNASWIEHTNYNETDFNNIVVIGGTYDDGSLADTWLLYEPDDTFSCEVFSFKTGRIKGNRYPLVIDIYIGEYNGYQNYKNPFKFATFSPNWAEFKNFYIENVTPFKFIKGKKYWIRFKTLNKSFNDVSLISMIYESFRPPEPKWNSSYNSWNSQPKNFSIEPSGFAFKKEFSDLYPTSWYVDENNDWQYEFNKLYFAGNPNMTFYSKQSSNSTPNISQFVYPFGAYYPSNSSNFKVNKLLRDKLLNFNFNVGWTTYPLRIDCTNILREPYIRHDNFALPRFIIHGDVKNNIILNNISAYIGTLFPNVVSCSCKMQAFIPYDKLGDALLQQVKINTAIFESYKLIDGNLVKNELNYSDIINAKNKGIISLINIKLYSSQDLTSSTLYEILKTISKEDWDGLNLEIHSFEDTIIDFVKTLYKSMRKNNKILQLCYVLTLNTSLDIPLNSRRFIFKTLNFCSSILFICNTNTNIKPQNLNIDMYSLCKTLYFTIPYKYHHKLYVNCNLYSVLYYKNSKSSMLIPYQEALAIGIKNSSEFVFSSSDNSYVFDTNNLKCFLSTSYDVNNMIYLASYYRFGGISFFESNSGDILETFPY